MCRRQVRQRMMKLKRAIEAKQAEIAAKELASKHESAAEYTARFRCVGGVRA